MKGVHRNEKSFGLFTKVFQKNPYLEFIVPA